MFEGLKNSLSHTRRMRLWVEHRLPALLQKGGSLTFPIRNDALGCFPVQQHSAHPFRAHQAVKEPGIRFLVGPDPVDAMLFL